MKSNLNEENSANQLLNKIRDALRKWYGTLSVKEIISNRVLIVEIEALERMLSKREVLS
ncbi:MAG: hypothetical protein KF865_03165 [Bdellovibrionaceae bacterium]|nr:hypothetical protein [Pseudobdellovibrionaceae bacterium]